MEQEQQQNIFQQPEPQKKRDRKKKESDDEEESQDSKTLEKEKVFCEKCENFISKQNFKYHIRHVHDKVRIDCLYCGKTFADKSNLSKHVSANHKSENKIIRMPSYERNYPCDTCDGKYKTAESLRVHKTRCEQIKLNQARNDPKQSKLKLKHKQSNSVEDLERKVKTDILEEEKENKNFGQLQQIRVDTPFIELQITPGLLNTSIDNIITLNNDDTITQEQTEDPSFIKDKIKIQTKPKVEIKETKEYQWIPSPDIPNFNTEFLDAIYTYITKESNILWALERLPDKNIPLSKSTRQQTAIQDQEWRQSKDNLVQNSQVSIGYGEATQQSIDKILGCFKENGFDDNSRFLDIGSGFGKVVFHVAALTNAMSYGIEINQARYQFSQQLLINLTQIQNNPLLQNIIKRVHFDQKDAGNCKKFLDNEGRYITHIYCFNAVFSADSNDKIATVINRTAGIQMFAWCIDAQGTAKYGIEDFKLVTSYNITLQGSGNHRKMYIFKRENKLDDSKIQKIKNMGLSEDIVSKIKNKIQSHLQKIQQQETEIDKDHNKAVAEKLIKIANFLSVNVLSLRQTQSVYQFILEFQKSNKVMAEFQQDSDIRSDLIQLEKVTQHNWFKVQTINGVEMIKRQGSNQQPAAIREQIETYYNINQHALIEQKINMNKEKIDFLIYKILQKAENYTLKIQTLNEEYYNQKSPYKQEYAIDSNEGLNISDRQYHTIDLMIIGLKVDENPNLNWEYINEENKERLQAELVYLKDIEKQYRQIKEKLFRLKQFTIDYVKKNQKNIQNIKELDLSFHSQVKQWLKEKQLINQKDVFFIGSGAQGRVYKISKGQIRQCPEIKAPFVIKLYLRKKEEMQQELTTLQKIHEKQTVNSNYVVKFLGDFSMMTGHAFILKYYPYDLTTVLYKKMLTNFKQINYIACCILRGITAAHTLGISHRDIKPSNILMTEKLIPAICDFGFTPHTLKCGTNGYMAPELYTSKFSEQLELKKTDAWSVGVVLYQLYNGNKRPYDSLKENEFATQQSDELKLTFEKTVPKDAQDLIKCLLKRDPKQRLSVASAVNHKLFTGLQFLKNNLIDLTKLQ